MICPSCSYSNREGRKFCSECGVAFEIPCPHCQALNEPGEKFCGECGQPITDSALQPAPLPQAVEPSPHAAQEPSSFANGRYEVKRFLGEGGKKKVYLAQDTLLDRDVAFALIKTEGLSQRRETGHIFISHVAEDSSIAIQAADALEA